MVLMLLILEAVSRKYRKYMRSERLVKRNELERECPLFNRKFCLDGINRHIREHRLKSVFKEPCNLDIGFFQTLSDIPAEMIQIIGCDTIQLYSNIIRHIFADSKLLNIIAQYLNLILRQMFFECEG